MVDDNIDNRNWGYKEVRKEDRKFRYRLIYFLWRKYSLCGGDYRWVIVVMMTMYLGLGCYFFVFGFIGNWDDFDDGRYRWDIMVWKII